MLTRRYQFILTFLLCIFITQLSATVVKDLYSAKVPVANQSASTRSEAVRQAFLEVLVKVSGNSSVAEQSALRQAATDASKYIQQYSYLNNPDATDSGHPYLLQVRFGSKVINSLLLQQNISVWGQDRPLTLFWVATDINGKKTLLGSQNSSPIPNLIDNAADARGIPTIFPVLDLTDLNQVSIDDVMAPFVSTITQASVRYGSNTVVIVKLVNNNGKWSSFWTLVANAKMQNWTFKGDDDKSVITSGINQIADALATQFAVSNSMQNTQINVSVQGLQSLQAYAKARQYLQRLAPVKTVSLQQIQSDKVTYQVQLVGTIEDLQQAIRLDHVLRPIIHTDLNSIDETTTPTLEYQWTR